MAHERSRFRICIAHRRRGPFAQTPPAGPDGTRNQKEAPRECAVRSDCASETPCLGCHDGNEAAREPVNGFVCFQRHAKSTPFGSKCANDEIFSRVANGSGPWPRTRCTGAASRHERYRPPRDSQQQRACPVPVADRLHRANRPRSTSNHSARAITPECRIIMPWAIVGRRTSVNARKVSSQPALGIRADFRAAAVAGGFAKRARFILRSFIIRAILALDWDGFGPHFRLSRVRTKGLTAVAVI